MAEPLSASELLQRYQAGDRDFRHHRLAGLDLREADLRQADFSQAELQGADFGYADLRAATFVGADLSGANFRGAILAETDFTAANLNGTRGLDWRIPATAASDDDLAGSQTIAATRGVPTPSAWGAGSPAAATVISGAAAATSPLDTGRSEPSGDRNPELVLTPHETQDLIQQLQALQRWRGITTTIALVLLFVAVLGGYLGYVKYREYEQLEDRATAREAERERQLQELSVELDFLRQERQNLRLQEGRLEEISTELELIRQERQNLEMELANERERGANNVSQVTTLLDRLRETEAELQTEQERVRQLTEINELLQERLESRNQPAPLPTITTNPEN